MEPVGLVLGWLTGCGLGLLLLGRYPGGLDPMHSLTPFGLAAVAAIVAWLAKGATHLRRASLLLAAGLAGLATALTTSAPPPDGDITGWIGSSGGSQIAVVGRVTGDPASSDRSQRVRVAVEAAGQSATGQVAASSGILQAVLPRYPELQSGDRLVLTGKLTAPPSLPGFDLASGLARVGIRSYMYFPRVQSLPGCDGGGWARALAQARRRVAASLESVIAEPEAAVAVGVVTGDRSSIPSAVVDSFRRSGTSHVLAISGENITLLVGAVWLLAGGRGNRRRLPTWALLLVLCLVVLYTVFTGASASVVRAAIMAGLLLAGPLVGRRYDPLAALAFCALAMTALDPRTLADPGFELSFAAMAGIALISPLLYKPMVQARVGRVALPSWLAAALSAGLGAQLATAPILVMLTGQVSLVAPVATLFVDAALLPLMVAGALAGILGWLLPWLAWFAGCASWLFAWWMTAWAAVWAALPFSSVSIGTVEVIWVFCYYAALTGAVTLVRGQRRKSAREEA